MNAVKLAVEVQSTELEQLKARREAIEKEAKELRAKERELRKSKVGVTCKLYTVQKSGNTGMLINGVGKPLFLYKEHAVRLFGDSAEAVAERAKIMAFIIANDDELTDKDSE